jgi:hypothetical protein
LEVKFEQFDTKLSHLDDTEYNNDKNCDTAQQHSCIIIVHVICNSESHRVLLLFEHFEARIF